MRLIDSGCQAGSAERFSILDFRLVGTGPELVRPCSDVPESLLDVHCLWWTIGDCVQAWILADRYSSVQCSCARALYTPASRLRPHVAWAVIVADDMRSYR